MQSIAEKMARMQINLILICYKLTPTEKKAAEQFVNLVRKTRPGQHASEGFFCPDMDPKEVEKLFTKRIANFKLEYNQPLIMETFR
jgi:hypothetical protein